MRSIYLLLTLFVASNCSFCQSKTAIYCETSCPRLTIIKTKKTDFGVAGSSVFQITNNLSGAVKVGLYIKRTDGRVQSEGYSDPIDRGQSTTFHYNIDDLSEYCVYYINYPSDEKFPSSTEVKKRMNNGY
ncbi:MAG: hypothetical protein ABIN67_24070 [Ferruginibacter sp.]